MVYLLDPPGTVTILPASDPTGQAAALEQFCGSNSASCAFKVTSQVEALGPRHPVGNEVENDSSTTVTVAPHTVVQVVAEQPVYRVTGDFTIVMGNTTYIVQGVSFDSPNPNGRVGTSSRTGR